MNQPSGPNKKARDQIKSGKKEARIGFLESMGDSGYDNRSDPKYCFDILKNFMDKGGSDDKTGD